MTTKPLVLIPAAGLGLRVGRPHAKELLPGNDDRPLIAWGLEQARIRAWPIHVITRPQKTELIQYLKDYQKKNGCELHIQIIEASREWPDTLLQSEEYWREKNLLCLPDTLFQPVTVWDSLVASNADVAAATFQPADLSTWGALRKTSTGFSVCEKPLPSTLSLKFSLGEDTSPLVTNPAWGVLAWKKESGRVLLQAQLVSGIDHQWKDLKLSLELFALEEFQDVTRGQ